MAPSLTYLGHMIDQHGLHPLKEKVQAVKDSTSPKSVSELKSYLGLFTYYSNVLVNMADVLAPLYRLLRKEVRWRWTNTEEKAFQASEDLLTSLTLLMHFKPNLELVLMCDASSYGVSGVLAHHNPDGSERPIRGWSCSGMSRGMLLITYMHPTQSHRYRPYMRHTV